MRLQTDDVRLLEVEAGGGPAVPTNAMAAGFRVRKRMRFQQNYDY